MSSELPQITTEQISVRLASDQHSEIGGLKEKLAHLSLLAEALRDERDNSRTRLAELEQELAELRSTEVPDISSLGK